MYPASRHWRFAPLRSAHGSLLQRLEAFRRGLWFVHEPKSARCLAVDARLLQWTRLSAQTTYGFKRASLWKSSTGRRFLRFLRLPRLHHLEIFQGSHPES
eukprot:3900747-Pleurochrysis_carterae.AAC.1